MSTTNWIDRIFHPVANIDAATAQRLIKHPIFNAVLELQKTVHPRLCVYTVAKLHNHGDVQPGDDMHLVLGMRDNPVTPLVLDYSVISGSKAKSPQLEKRYSIRRANGFGSRSVPDTHVKLSDVEAFSTDPRKMVRSLNTKMRKAGITIQQYLETSESRPTRVLTYLLHHAVKKFLAQHSDAASESRRLVFDRYQDVIASMLAGNPVTLDEAQRDYITSTVKHYELMAAEHNASRKRFWDTFAKSKLIVGVKRGMIMLGTINGTPIIDRYLQNPWTTMLPEEAAGSCFAGQEKLALYPNWDAVPEDFRNEVKGALAALKMYRESIEGPVYRSSWQDEVDPDGLIPFDTERHWFEAEASAMCPDGAYPAHDVWQFVFMTR